jgi:hypothetical protein
MSRKDTIHFEAADGLEDGSTFAFQRDGRLAVSVAEEQAVDSYNSMFTCTHHLTRDQAVKLRDFLIANLGAAA